MAGTVPCLFADYEVFFFDPWKVLFCWKVQTKWVGILWVWSYACKVCELSLKFHHVCMMRPSWSWYAKKTFISIQYVCIVYRSTLHTVDVFSAMQYICIVVHLTLSMVLASKSWLWVKRLTLNFAVNFSILPTVYLFLGATRRPVCGLRPLRECCFASAWHGCEKWWPRVPLGSDEAS